MAVANRNIRSRFRNVAATRSQLAPGPPPLRGVPTRGDFAQAVHAQFEFMAQTLEHVAFFIGLGDANAARDLIGPFAVRAVHVEEIV